MKSSPSPVGVRAVNDEPLRALVVPHTHWDRAWYWPFERHRARLCECLSVLLETMRRHEDFHFTGDGQTLMFEDYLEVRPGERAELQRYANQGRLATGPMYCLADVYCTGVEALVRNFQLGMAWARDFGGLMRVVHMPDTFGITPNLPAVCAGFGCGTFVFMRGHPAELPGSFHMQQTGEGRGPLPVEQRLFFWKDASGSMVRVIRLRDGYANAARLARHPEPGAPTEDLAAAAEKLLGAAEKQNDGQGEPVVLMAGVDHQFPQSRLPELIQLAEQGGRWRFHLVGLDEAGRLAESRLADDWPVFEGEFHGRGAASVLGGTVSTRIYLKIANARVEQLLVHQAEPAAALANWLGWSDPSFATLPVAWKTLLRAHPHDNICGCSVDSVHRADEMAIEQAGHAADAVRRRGIIQLYRRYGANRPGDGRLSFALCNTQAVERLGITDLILDTEGQRRWGDIRLPRRYRIVDESGTEVPFREVERGTSREHPHAFARLELQVRLPPLAFRRYYLEPVEGAWTARPCREVTLENKRLSVTIQETGEMCMTDRRTGAEWPGLGCFSGQADVGDSYDFSDLPGEHEIILPMNRPKLLQLPSEGGLQSAAVEGRLSVPEECRKDRRGRSARLAKLPVRIEYSLGPDAAHLEVRVVFTNTARDHRLRWNLISPAPVAESMAGVKMRVLHRPAGEAPTGDRPPRVHPEHPADEFVAFPAAPNGLACFSRFPFNYEIVEGRRLAITVMRSVGYLCSPVELATRPGLGAGPHTATPDAQCPGRRIDIRLALRPFAMEESDTLLGEAMLWRAEPLRGQMDATVPYIEQTDSTEPPSLMWAEGPVVLTACKPALDDGGWVVRFFNPSSQPVSTQVRFARTVGLLECGLDEIPNGQRSERGDRHPLDLAGYGWRTCRIISS